MEEDVSPFVYFRGKS